MHCAVEVSPVSILRINTGLEIPVSHPGAMLVIDSEQIGHMVGI